jgi:hypothetical protein
MRSSRLSQMMMSRMLSGHRRRHNDGLSECAGMSPERVDLLLPTKRLACPLKLRLIKENLARTTRCEPNV